MSTPSTLPSCSPKVAACPPAFQSLSRIEKRRAICRDVLAQLKAKKVVALRGAFVKYNISVDYIQIMEARNRVVDNTITVRELLAQLPPVQPCEVCALGGLLLSQLRVNGDCPAADVSATVASYGEVDIAPFADTDEGETFSPFIRRYFAPTQLQLIEMAFEQGNGCFSAGCILADLDDGTDSPADARERWSDDGLLPTMADARRAIAFGNRYEDSEKRLAAIMRKIIKHPEARFVP